jgi:Xaa-Pro aminopeptidase
VTVRHLERIREALGEAGADALWVHPAIDFRYLTGLAPIAMERPTALVILGEAVRVLAPEMLAPELALDPGILSGLRVRKAPDELERLRATIGHVFNVEPGIYVPGRFGVRYENLVHLGADGPELLNAA